MKIAATAQPIGFGPASNLLSIMKPYRHLSVSYFGFGTAYEYFSKSGVHPYYIDEHEEFMTTYRFLVDHSIELLITVMGSKAAILAKKLGIKVIYIDLVYWMWEFDEQQYTISALKEQFLAWSLDDLEKQVFFQEGTNDSKRMLTSLLAHVSADKSLVEEFIPTTGHNLAWIQQLPHSHFVTPLLDVTPKIEQRQIKNKRYLVSLGGLQTYNHYRFIIADVVKRLGEDQCTVIGSAKNLQSLAAKTLPIEEYLMELQQHQLVMAQPGFSTLYEMFQQNIVPLILPAQNVGQLKFVRFLQQYLPPEQFISWEHIYEQGERSERDFIEEINRKMIDDPTLTSTIYQLLVERIKEHEQHYSDYLQKQQQLMDDLLTRHHDISYFLERELQR